MLAEVREQVEATVAPLVSGILSDAQKLIRQEVALAKSEVRREVVKVKAGAVSGAVGAGLVLLGSILFTLGLVHLLHYLVPSLQLWGSYGVVALVFLTAGAVFCVKAKNTLGNVDMVPEKTIENIKENAEWVRQKI